MLNYARKKPPLENIIDTYSLQNTLDKVILIGFVDL